MSDIRSRDQKGFDFELTVMRALDKINNLRYRANPRTFYEWKHTIALGADIILPFAEVECKFLKSRVYKSWIERDYIPRFNGYAKDQIIVTNWKWYIPIDCRKLLYRYKIKVMDLGDFITYVMNKLKKLKSKGNKRHFGITFYITSFEWYYVYCNGSYVKYLLDYT